jgi:DNA-binding response OmpR family regulator
MKLLAGSRQSQNGASEPKETSSATDICVVVIETDYKRALSTCGALRSAGFRTVGATDSATAIQLIYVHTPTVVLLGSMSRAQGVPLCAGIKQAVPNAVVLVYTAEPEAWQRSADFITGVVPPYASSPELVEEICAWVTHLEPCSGMRK